MEISVVTAGGRVMIPVSLRRRTGVKPGTRVFFEEKDGDIIIHPITAAFYDRHCGFLKGSSLLEALERSRRSEKQHEYRKFGKH